MNKTLELAGAIRLKRRLPGFEWSEPCGKSWGQNEEPRIGKHFSRVLRVEIDDGGTHCLSSDPTTEIRRLEQELREMKSANDLLKRAASFLQAALGRQHKI